MSQVRLGRGVVAQLGEALDLFGARRVVVVVGGASYARCGAQTAVDSALIGRDAVTVQADGPLPELGLARRVAQVVEEHAPDVILAVGGGTPMDVAKLASAFAGASADARDIATGRATVSAEGVPVIAVPTTAGTGAEATRFAVVYVDGEKYSVSHPRLRPVVAVVDAALTDTLPARLTAATGLDALAQALESMWSVRATHESLVLAERAARLAYAGIERAVHTPDAHARDVMAEAAHLAGRAIDLTTTTAPHALSYRMTSKWGVPHGHAVALTLAPVFAYNARVTEADQVGEGTASRTRVVTDVIVSLVGGRDLDDATRKLGGVLGRVGLPDRLSSLGIRTAEDRLEIVRSVNPQRLANNPRQLSTEAIAKLLEQVS